MIRNVYIEDEVREHPRTRDILDQLDNCNRIYCDRYTEVFNRKSQNFRMQKTQPALILASKHDNHVLPIPENYQLAGQASYYFSHMLNCIFDCRYCFLQGMYRSAHYVVFVNYEDFIDAIISKIDMHSNEQVCLFSGYDCDSLALDPLTGFTGFFIPAISGLHSACLELRTKSTQVHSLLKQEAVKNCVIAFSFTPEAISRALEHRVPAVKKRIQVIRKLQEHGWQTGLRIDPLIYCEDYRTHYADLFEQIFSIIDPESIHSVSLGSFRMPDDYFRNLHKLYPDERMFASPLQSRNGNTGYLKDIEEGMLDFCHSRLLEYIPAGRLFPCLTPGRRPAPGNNLNYHGQVPIE